MVEKIFRFRAGELTFLKVVCGHCKTAIEIQVDSETIRKFDSIRNGVCHFCGEPLRSKSAPAMDAIGNLVRDLELVAMAEKEGNATIEFALSIHKGE